MRLISFTAKNFKGIDESGATLNLAPITLLFGPNNAGKSTLSQAMRLAREVICNDDYNPRDMNLGGFANYVYKHELERTVHFGFTFAPEPEDYNRLSIEPYKVIEETKDIIKDLSVEIVIRWNKDLEKVEWCHYEVAINGNMLTKIKRNMNDSSKIFMERLQGPIDIFISENQLAELDRLGDNIFEINEDDYVDDYDDDNNFYAAMLGERFVYKEELVASINSNLHDVIDWDYILEQINCGDDPGAVLDLLDITGSGDIEIRSSYKGFNDLFNNVLRTTEDVSLEESQYLSEEDIIKLGPEFADMITKAKDKKLARKIITEFIYMVPGRNKDKYISSLVLTPGKMLRKWFLENPFLYIGPLRDIPPRDFSINSDKPNEWSRGTAAWYVLLKSDKEQIKRINDSLKGEHFGYTIEQKTVPSFDLVLDDVSSDKPLTEKRVILRNSKTNTPVFPCDMGTGISQVIPIVVAADIANKDSMVMFEQPELHIHPKLQVELGDILISAIHRKSEESNTPIFLIETHSEHLILRLLRRVRETNDGELFNGYPVTPEMFSVAYVQPNTKNGTEITPLHITNDGDFSRKWPNGFFDERAEELF